MKTIFPILFLLFLQINLSAQTFVKADATGNNDGSSWADAFTTLQTALDAASEGSDLWIAAGTYKPETNVLPDSNWFSVDKALNLYGGFDGTENSLEERDWTSNFTILSGDILGDDVDDNFSEFKEDNARHVLRASDLSGTLIIDGLLIKNSNTLTEDIPDFTADLSTYGGSGLFLLNTKAEVKNCTIRQCNGNLGTALFFQSNGNEIDELLLENSILENNNSQHGNVWVQTANNPIIRNCTFTGNNSLDFGGAITLGNTNAFIEDCTFTANSTPTLLAGAIFIFQNSGNTILDPTISIHNSSFVENFALGGGAIAFNNFYPNSSINIDSCTFTRNISNHSNETGFAGAILIQNIEDTFGGGLSSMSSNITNSTFDQNSATLGGAIYHYSNAETVDHYFQNVNFTNNSSDDFGGALILGNATAVMEDCSFTNNAAPNSLGGAVFIFENGDNTDPTPNFEIKRTIFENNEASFGGGLAFNNFIPNSSISIDSCDFIRNMSNTTGNGIGGGILLQNIGTPTTPYSSLNADIKNCFLDRNASVNGGGIRIRSSSDSLWVNITESTFTENAATGFGGGISFTSEEGYSLFNMDKNIFSENTTDFAGGAIYLDGANNASIYNSQFSENDSEGDGSVLAIEDNSRVRMENILMNDNGGNSSIINSDSLWLINATVVENNSGILQANGSYLSLQNSIFSNEDGNLSEMGTVTIISKGGNLSSDSTMVDYLTGFDSYSDFNGQSADLDVDFTPNPSSVCLDAGNADGVMNAFDLNGNDRIQGSQIDMGAFESPFDVSTRILEFLDFKIAPNPFHDYLNIDLEEIDLSNTRIEILDAMGRIIHSQKINTPSVTINQLSHFAPGAYLLKVTTEDKFYSQLIVKQ